MLRTTSARYAAMALLIPSVIALAGCGHSSGSKSSSSSSGSSGSSSSGKCAAGYVSGTIAGQAKCLQNGQQCQDSNSSDYKKYGFTCTKNSGRYELKKK
jgi:hypothetical protein